MVDSNCKILYSESKLHSLLKQLLSKPEIFRNFMQRFADEYWKLKEGSFMDLMELDLIGIKTEKF